VVDIPSCFHFQLKYQLFCEYANHIININFETIVYSHCISCEMCTNNTSTNNHNNPLSGARSSQYWSLERPCDTKDWAKSDKKKKNKKL